MDLVDSSQSIYLFYEHGGVSPYDYTLYKIDVNLTRATTTTVVDLSPILDFPNKDLGHLLNFVPTEENKTPPTHDFRTQGYQKRRGMRCAQLGSKLYFLGGTYEILKDFVDIEKFPKDVHVLDLLTKKFTRMDASLNAGKPSPCAVFAANGKLYALGSFPTTASSAELSRMKLFECFDPTTGKWEVLDNLPPVGLEYPPPPHMHDDTFKHTPKRIEWGECNVLRKHQQVVLHGCENIIHHVTFVYHIQQGRWTRLNHILQVSSLQEGRDGDHLYGTPFDFGPPLKSKTVDHLVLSDGVVEMSIPGVPTLVEKNYAEWVSTYFGDPYLHPGRKLLLYLGNDHFCYMACGMCCSVDSPDRYGYEFPNVYIRGITMILFKEKKNHGDLCFQAEIMHTQDYRMKSKYVNNAKLVNCFVVDLERLQKKLGERKDKKKKKKEEKLFK